MPEFLSKWTYDTATAPIEALHTLPIASKPLENLTSNRSDSLFPIESSANTLAAQSDSNLRIEWPTTKQSDISGLAEFSSLGRGDNGATIETQRITNADIKAALESIHSLLGDSIPRVEIPSGIIILSPDRILPIETVFNIRTDAVLPIEAQFSVRSDTNNPVEILAAFALLSTDKVFYLETTGNLALDAKPQIEYLRGIRNDSKPLIEDVALQISDSVLKDEYSSRGQGDFNSLGEFTASFAVISDATPKIEYLCYVRSDPNSPIENLGAFALRSFDSLCHIETIGSLASETFTKTEFLFRARQDSNSPTEVLVAFAYVLADNSLPIEMLYRVYNTAHTIPELISNSLINPISNMESVANRSRDSVSQVEEIKSIGTLDFNLPVASLATQQSDPSVQNEFATILAVLRTSDSLLPIEFIKSLVIYGKPIESLRGLQGDSLFQFESAGTTYTPIFNDNFNPIEFLASQQADLPNTFPTSIPVFHVVRRIIQNDDGTFTRRLIFVTTYPGTGGGAFLELLGGQKGDTTSKIEEFTSHKLDSPFIDEFSLAVIKASKSSISFVKSVLPKDSVLPIDTTIGERSDYIANVSYLKGHRTDTLLGSELLTQGAFDNRIPISILARVTSQDYINPIESSISLSTDKISQNEWLTSLTFLHGDSLLPVELSALAGRRDTLDLVEFLVGQVNDFSLPIDIVFRQYKDILLSVESTLIFKYDSVIQNEQLRQIRSDGNFKEEWFRRLSNDSNGALEFSGIIPVIFRGDSLLQIEFNKSFVVYGKPIESLHGIRGDGLLPIEHVGTILASLTGDNTLPVECLTSLRSDLQDKFVTSRPVLQVVRRIFQNPDGTFSRRLLFITTYQPTTGGAFLELLARQVLDTNLPTELRVLGAKSDTIIWPEFRSQLRPDIILPQEFQYQGRFDNLFRDETLFRNQSNYVSPQETLYRSKVDASIEPEWVGGVAVVQDALSPIEFLKGAKADCGKYIEAITKGLADSLVYGESALTVVRDGVAPPEVLFGGQRDNPIPLELSGTFNIDTKTLASLLGGQQFDSLFRTETTGIWSRDNVFSKEFVVRRIRDFGVLNEWLGAGVRITDINAVIEIISNVYKENIFRTEITSAGAALLREAALFVDVLTQAYSDSPTLGSSLLGVARDAIAQVEWHKSARSELATSIEAFKSALVDTVSQIYWLNSTRGGDAKTLAEFVTWTTADSNTKHSLMNAYKMDSIFTTELLAGRAVDTKTLIDLLNPMFQDSISLHEIQGILTSNFVARSSWSGQLFQDNLTRNDWLFGQSGMPALPVVVLRALRGDSNSLMEVLTSAGYVAADNVLSIEALFGQISKSSLPAEVLRTLHGDSNALLEVLTSFGYVAADNALAIEALLGQVSKSVLPIGMLRALRGDSSSLLEVLTAIGYVTANNALAIEALLGRISKSALPIGALRTLRGDTNSLLETLTAIGYVTADNTLSIETLFSNKLDNPSSVEYINEMVARLRNAPIQVEWNITIAANYDIILEITAPLTAVTSALLEFHGIPSYVTLRSRGRLANSPGKLRISIPLGKIRIT